ncbi:MAG: hypothetical protein JNM93_13395 [Bacteriovoracaceae bacterium]|nr:hypothetical protein [Bacteriovoracaceae bacterium]
MKILKQFLCLVLNYSLVFSPSFAWSQGDSEPSDVDTRPSKTFNQKVKDFGTTYRNVSNTIAPLANQVQQQMQSVQQQQQMQQYASQMVISTHTENFLGRDCEVLKSRTDRPSLDVCDASMATDPGTAAMFKQIQAIAEQNYNLADNYIVMGQPGASLGIQCVDEAMKDMENKLEARVNEMKQILRDIENAEREFSKQADLDRKNLEKLNSLLTGKGIDKNQLDTLFNDTFTDNNCKQAFTKGQLTGAANNGLQGIRDEIRTQKTDPQTGRDLASEVIKNQSAMRQDIANVASKLGKYIKESGLKPLNPNGDPVAEQMNVVRSSTYGAAMDDTYQRILARNNTDLISKTREIDRKISQLGITDSATRASILDPDKNTAQALKSWENEQYSSCMNRVLFGSDSKDISPDKMDAWTKNFKTNNNRVSKNSTSADNVINDIKRILPDNTIDFQQRMQTLIKSAAAQRDFVYNSGSTKNELPTISGCPQKSTQLINASSLLEGYDCYCKQMFKTRKNKDGLTNADILAQATTLRNEYSKVSQNYNQNVQNDIVKTMVNCEGVPTGDTCSKSNLQSDSANFCVNNAVKCASSMNGCENKVQDIIKKTTDGKIAIANQINRNVANFQENQFKLFRMAEEKTKAFSQVYASYFVSPPAFKLPVGYESTNLPVPQFDQALGVDIISANEQKKLMDAFKKNITTLIGKPGKNGDGILGHNDAMKALAAERKEQIAKNLNTEKAYWQDLAQSCKGAVASYNTNANQGYAKSTEQYGDYLKDVNKCRRTVSRFGAGCNDQTEGLVSELEIIAGKININESSLQNIGQWSDYCSNFMAEGQNRRDSDFTEIFLAELRDKEKSKAIDVTTYAGATRFCEENMNNECGRLTALSPEDNDRVEDLINQCKSQYKDKEESAARMACESKVEKFFDTAAKYSRTSRQIASETFALGGSNKTKEEVNEKFRKFGEQVDSICASENGNGMNKVGQQGSSDIFDIGSFSQSF